MWRGSGSRIRCSTASPSWWTDMELLSQLGHLIPVVVLRDERDAEPLARALLAGGVPTMEVTFRTSAAQGALQRVAAGVPAMLLGAGTVLTADQAKAAVASGARYIVSPGFVPEVVGYCRDA